MKPIIRIRLLLLFSLLASALAAGATEIPSNKDNVRSLDGTWRFKLEQTKGNYEGMGMKPRVPVNYPKTFEPFYKTDYKESDSTGWVDLKVPGNWEMSGHSPATYVQPDNASGFYRLWFEVPGQWRGKIIKINFDGVQNGAELWLNGQPVKVDEPSWGRENYHESGWTAFQADLTPHVKFGEKNLIALRVTKNTRSSDLDKGDYFFLGGIYRSVTLFCVPQTHLDDITVQTRLLGVDGTGGANKAEVRVIAKVAGPDAATLTAILDSGNTVARVNTTVANGAADLRFIVDNPSLWSAEFPNLHDLTVTLVDANGRGIDFAKKRIGIREVTIENSVLLLNGVPIKMAGMCRHDVSPDEGTAVGPALWRKDIELMNASNINAIRTSHYPYGSGFYDLCDELGMYVIDELPYCWTHTDGKEMEPAFLQRARETIRRDKNHPCVLVWAIGNENKEGRNLQAVADLVKTLDDTRPRLVSWFSWDKYQTELSDSHYTKPSTIREAAKTAAANGHPHIYLENPNTWDVRLGADAGTWDAWGLVMQRSWDAIMESDAVPGTFIFEWQDRAVADKSPIKQYYFFEKTGIHLMKIKGLVDGFRNPRSRLYDLKNIYSPIQIPPDTQLTRTGNTATFPIENRYSFTNLSQVVIKYTLLAGANNLPLGIATAHADIAPRSTGKLTLQLPSDSDPAFLKEADAIRVDFETPSGQNIISHQFTLRDPAPREMAATLPRNLLFPQFNLVTYTQIKNETIWQAISRESIKLDNIKYSSKVAASSPVSRRGEQDAPPALTTGLAMDADLIKSTTDGLKEKVGRVHCELGDDNRFRYRLEWSGPKADVLELGWLFTMPAQYDRFSWKRQAPWTVYPPTHIGRPTGTARPDTMDVDVTKITRPDAFDFNSTKYNCDWAALEDASASSGLMIRFDPKQRHQCRAGKNDNGDYILAVHKHASPPNDISSNVAPELYLTLKPGTVIESSFVIGSAENTTGTVMENINKDLRANPLYIQAGAPHAAPNAIVTVDHAAPLLKTDLTLGITHTHYRWENGNPSATARAEKLLKSIGGFQNTFIMGWGPTHIKTDIHGIPSNLDTSLTPRVNLVTRLAPSGEGIITFCTAPIWMKPSGTGDPDAPVDPSIYAPDEAPLPQYEDAFATLCAAIAQKYPRIKYFQVWNEFKGMWNAKTKDWDYERYTRLYNKVYTAVKRARPDAQIGGFYLAFATDGSAKTLGTPGHPDTVGMPLSDKERRGLRYFLANAAGLDFLCVDRHTIAWHNPKKGRYTDTQAMQLTPVWQTFMREIVAELNRTPKYKNLPVMYSEYYASLSGYLNTHDGPAGEVTGGADYAQYAAAHYASIYNHILKGSSGQKTWMLLWMQDAETIPFNALFTHTKSPDGGRPNPLYWVMHAYKTHFADAPLLKTDSTTPDIEVTATRDASIIINKRNTPVAINININNTPRGLTLPPYGVALVDLTAEKNAVAQK